MKKMLPLMLAATMLLETTGLCLAQSQSKPIQSQSKPIQSQLKPILTVSFAGYDRFMADIGMIGQLGGCPDFTKQLKVLLELLPKGEGAKNGPLGLDTRRPWGLVTPNGPAATCYVFLPLADITPLVGLLTPYCNGAIKVKAGVYEIPLLIRTIYATRKGKWVYLTDWQQHLTNAVGDPATLLGDLPKKYDLAVRLSIKDISSANRQMSLDELHGVARMYFEPRSYEGEMASALRRNIVRQILHHVTVMVNEADYVLLGWNVDAKTKSTYLNYEFAARTGTKLARQVAQVKPGKTCFGGFLLPDAAVVANCLGAVTGNAQIAQTQKGLASLRESAAEQLEKCRLTDDQLKPISRMLDDVTGVLQKMVTSEKNDIAMSLLLDPAAVTLVAGAAITDGASLDKSFGQLADAVRKDGDLAKSVKVSTETYQTIPLHIFSLPTPDRCLVPMVGKTLEVVIGITDDKLLVAAGRNAAQTLKKAIDQSASTAGKELPPLQISLALRTVVKFFGNVTDDERLKIIAPVLEKAGDQDHVSLSVTPIPQGLRLRLEGEEGLLKAVGSVLPLLSALLINGGF